MMRPLCLALALALLCGCGRSAAVLRESTVRVSAPVYGVFVRSELLWPDCGGGLDELQRVSAAVGAPASGAFSKLNFSGSRSRSISRLSNISPVILALRTRAILKRRKSFLFRHQA